MARRKPKVKWADRPLANTQSEAIDSIMDGLRYFIKKRPIVTLSFLGAMLVGIFYAGNYFVFEKKNVEFEKRQPLSEQVDTIPDGLFTASLYAASGDRPVKGDTLWIAGKPWAVVDPQYRVWKVAGEPRIVIQDMRDSLAPPLFLYVEGMDDAAIQMQYKKSK